MTTGENNTVLDGVRERCALKLSCRGHLRARRGRRGENNPRKPNCDTFGPNEYYRMAAKTRLIPRMLVEKNP